MVVDEKGDTALLLNSHKEKTGDTDDGHDDSDAMRRQGGNGITTTRAYDTPNYSEALIQSGVNAGLEADVAKHLVVETVIGAGELLKATGRDPAELRKQVSSPGGTTVAGLAVMDQLGFDRIVESAVRAAIERSRELAGPS